MITIAVRVRLLDLAQHFDPIDAGQDDVQQDEVRLLLLKKLQAILAGERVNTSKPSCRKPREMVRSVSSSSSMIRAE